MAITPEDLIRAVGANPATDTLEISRCQELATLMVDTALENAWRPVHEWVYEECILRTFVNLFKSKTASDGGSMLSADGRAVPGVANDPLQKSWPLIKRYINRL